jgi:hypothetical protein
MSKSVAQAELAPPREAVGGLYTRVLKNSLMYEQMINFSVPQGDGTQEVATILKNVRECY